MLDDNELLFDELYEKTKDCGRVQFINLLMEKEREKQELKKKLDELQTLYNNMFKCHCNRVQVETLLTHQTEFIEWLEANLEALEMCDRELILTNNKKEIKAYKEVLSKYKEIIGGKHE